MSQNTTMLQDFINSNSNHSPQYPGFFNTPFGSVFSTWKNHLPEAFKEQFLMPANAPYYIMLEGQMSKVWHRPKWFKPFLWILSWFDLLFPETGNNISASMSIIGGYNQIGEPYHVWNRTFSFPTKRRFNAIMEFNSTANCVVERLGPLGLLEMHWNIHFKSPNTLEIVTSGCYVRIGKRNYPLPKLTFPTVQAVETLIDEEQNKIHINLTVSHTKLGQIFGYEGTFQIQRIYKKDDTTTHNSIS